MFKITVTEDTRGQVETGSAWVQTAEEVQAHREAIYADKLPRGSVRTVTVTEHKN